MTGLRSSWSIVRRSPRNVGWRLWLFVLSLANCTETPQPAASSPSAAVSSPSAPASVRADGGGRPDSSDATRDDDYKEPLKVSIETSPTTTPGLWQVRAVQREVGLDSHLWDVRDPYRCGVLKPGGERSHDFRFGTLYCGPGLATWLQLGGKGGISLPKTDRRLEWSYGVEHPSVTCELGGNPKPLRLLIEREFKGNAPPDMAPGLRLYDFWMRPPELGLRIHLTETLGPMDCRGTRILPDTTYTHISCTYDPVMMFDLEGRVLHVKTRNDGGDGTVHFNFGINIPCEYKFERPYFRLRDSDWADALDTPCSVACKDASERCQDVCHAQLPGQTGKTWDCVGKCEARLLPCQLECGGVDPFE